MPATSPGRAAPRDGARRRRLALVLVLGAMLLPARAPAETNEERRFRQLEAQLERTEKELESLRQQVEQQKAVTHATQRQVEDVETAAKGTADKVGKGPDLADWL